LRKKTTSKTICKSLDSRNGGAARKRRKRKKKKKNKKKNSQRQHERFEPLPAMKCRDSLSTK
jgi:hypothetical protein